MARRPAVTAPAPRAQLQAAGRQIQPTGDEARHALALREGWQTLAWDYYDAVGEVKHAVNYKADAVRQCPLFAGRIDENGEIVPSESPAAVDSLARLAGPSGSHAEIMREGSIHLDVPGACWLVGLAARPGMAERWFIASLAEIEMSAGRVTVNDPDTGKKVPLRAGDDTPMGEQPDFWAKLWRRHPRKSHEADSAVRGVLAICEEMLILDRAMRSLARSRIAMGKILYVPNDVSFGPVDPSLDETEGDQFNRQMLEVFTTPIQDEGSASAVAPAVLRGPRTDKGSQIEVISIDREEHRLLQDRARWVMTRLAQGLSVPVEVVTGLGQANHWGAGQIELQAFRQYIAPMAELLVESLTVAYHHPTLRAAGMADEDIAREVIWYSDDDFGESSQDATEGYRLGLISGDAWRRVKNYGPEDAPLPSETPPVEAVTASALPDLGGRLAAIDLALMLQLEAAADTTVRSLLAKIGARIADRARKDQVVTAAIAQVPREAVAATLGRERVESITDAYEIIDAALAPLLARFERLVADAQSQALELVPGLEDAERGIIEAAAATARAQARDWLGGALRVHVDSLIYDPTPEATGEAIGTGSVVPMRIIREAMALAGGAGGIRASGDLLALAGGVIAGGVALGVMVLDIFRRHSIRVDGFTWVHNPGANSFDPHADLDGQEYILTNDEVLANPYPFPAADYFAPGDHSGCRCQAVPIMVSIEED